METEIRHILPAALTFSSKGEQGQETLELTLCGPSYKHRKFGRKLKQKVMNAMFSLSNHAPEGVEKEDKKEKPLTVDAIIMLLSSSPMEAFDWDEFLGWFWKEILKTGLVLVDAETPLTEPLAERINAMGEMGDDPLEAVAGAYILAFIWPSLVPTATGTET